MDRRRPRLDGRRRALRTGPTPSSTSARRSAPGDGTFADVDRAARGAGRRRCRPKGSGRATWSCSSCRTGSRPASPSGRRPTWARSWSPSCTSTAPKEVDYILRATEPDVVVTADRFGHSDHLANYEALLADRPGPRWLVVGDTPASGLPDAGGRRSRRCWTPSPSPSPCRSTRTRRRSSPSPRARPATPRASSTRTGRSASRPASSTTCSPGAARRRSPARRSGTSSGWSTRSSSRCCGSGPVNLVDVWDPGEVLRLMREEGLGVTGGATYFLDQPARPPRLHRRAPRPDALRRARRVHRAGRGHGAASRPWASTAFRSYGSTEHPSITGCLLDDPEEKRQTTDGHLLPGRRAAPRRRRRDPQPGPRLLHRLHRPGPDGAGFRRRRLVPHRRRRRPRRRRLPHHHRPALRHHHPRRREHQRPGDRGAADGHGRRRRGQRRGRARRAPRASTPRRCSACTRAPTAPTLDDVRAHLGAAGLARQKWPESLHAVDDFPRTPSGKVQKFVLRRQLKDSQ